MKRGQYCRDLADRPERFHVVAARRDRRQSSVFKPVEDPILLGVNLECGQVEQHEAQGYEGVEEVGEPRPLGLEANPVGMVAVHQEDAELRRRRPNPRLKLIDKTDRSSKGRSDSATTHRSSEAIVR